MTIAISIGIFLTIILLVEGTYFFYHQYVSPQSRTLKRRLRGGAARPKEGVEALEIIRQRKLSDLPWLNDTAVLHVQSWWIGKTSPASQ